MATPNQMPKKPPSKLKQQIMSSLIAISPSAWDRKTLAKDDAGKEIVETHRQVRSVLRYPLAQNVSDANVDRLAERWL